MDWAEPLVLILPREGLGSCRHLVPVGKLGRWICSITIRKASIASFNEAAPKETYEQRFRRFVKFIKDKRPHGIIEVVITGHQFVWIPILTDLGFDKVTSGKNSNTGATVNIYHLVY
jgi:hypothetical protein